MWTEDFNGFTDVTGNTAEEHLADVIIEKVEINWS